MSWVIPIAMYGLASLDAAFAGFRIAAGRNPLLEKRRYYARAVGRGWFVGQGVILLVAVTIAATHLLAVAPQAVWQAHLRAGGDMLWWYLPYAVLVLSALVVYAAPDPDVSSLATVLVLGPFTAARPLVIVAGGTFALVRRGFSGAGTSVVIACGAMLALQPLLARRWRHRAPLEIARRARATATPTNPEP
ncbi:MAG: hypothetical protein AAGN82_19475 [Myxococcota bacterium]